MAARRAIPTAKPAVTRRVKRKERRNRTKTAVKQWKSQLYAFVGATILLLLVVASAIYWEEIALQWIDQVEVETDPVMVKRITIAGRITHVEPTRIKQLVDHYGREGMLALDPEQLRIALEDEPWIYRARVRKVWPDQIELAIEEQRAAARWGERGYLNLSGEFFGADGVELSAAELPSIEADQQDTVSIYQQLIRFSDILDKRVEQNPILKMVVDQRGAYTLLLGGNLELSLGRRLMEQRLTRWVRQSPVIMEEFGEKIKRVDLRYERGMVLELKQPS